MSTSKIVTAFGAAALLVAAPTGYALAGQGDPGKPENPGGVHQCEDGEDNDQDGKADYAEDGSGDPDCGSPRDNSEGADEDDAPDEETPGGGTPALPELPPALPELPPALPELPPALPELPPGGAPGLPELPAAPALPAEVQAVVDEVLGQLPPAP